MNSQNVVLVSTSGFNAPNHIARYSFYGKLFSAAISYAEHPKEAGFDECFILSAQHGLIEMGELVKSDLAFRRMELHDRMSWCRSVVKSLREHGYHSSTFVTLVGTGPHINTLAAYLRRVGYTIIVPLKGKGLKMESQISWLREHTDTEAALVGGLARLVVRRLKLAARSQL